MTAVLATGLVIVSGPAGAQRTPPPAAPTSKPIAQLNACRTETDATRRLACYDRAVDALAAATASNEVVVVERTEVRRARKGLFGFTLPSVGFLTGRKDSAEDQADAAELVTTITASHSLGYDKWSFTVESGATWVTVESSSAFAEPRVGRKVTLTKGSLGAFYAKVEGGRRVQAKRVG